MKTRKRPAAKAKETGRPAAKTHQTQGSGPAAKTDETQRNRPTAKADGARNNRPAAKPADGAQKEESTMSKTEAAQEAFKHLNQNINLMVEPWMRAVQVWTSEAEKMQQSAKDNFTKMLDNSHRLAKESIEMATTIGQTLHKQVTTQLERTAALMTTFTQH